MRGRSRGWVRVDVPLYLQEQVRCAIDTEKRDGQPRAGRTTGRCRTTAPGGTSKAFYAAVFGYEYGDMTDRVSYATFKIDGMGVGSIGGYHSGLPADTPATWRVYFSAADTDATTARAQAKGGSVVWEPKDHPSGRLSTVTDDQGAHFSILALTSG
jgi:predicted enzyme related to lactoylglutathione lyase